MSVILFDNGNRSGLYPFTLTRAVADLRFGIFSFRERWECITGEKVYVHTEKWLQDLYEPLPLGDHTWVDASVIADESLQDRICSLETGHCLADENGLIAGRFTYAGSIFQPAAALSFFQTIQDQPQVQRVQHPWQFMQWNDAMIRRDFEIVIKQAGSQPIPASVNVLGQEQVFIEAGARLSFCTINASTGPVYIGKNAEIMEGSVVRGPFVLGEGSVLKLNSRVYGATTLGPFCMGGGEIKNAVMMGYSNKAHDGYLGDSVVGHWCNFGAGSSNSNVKNTAGEVKIWDMGSEKYQSVGLKCGVVMGDYSRVAINSSINTGSMIGVSANVFGAGLLPTIINNFSWGVTGTRYDFEKALLAVDNWKKLKGHALSGEEAAVLKHIFDNQF